MITKSFLMAALVFAPTWLGLDTGLLESQDLSLAQEDVINKPQKVGESVGVKVTAQSALVIDKKSGKVLFSKNPNDVRAMASTTKVMTALVAIDSGKSLADVVTVPDEAVGIEGAGMKLLKDEQVTFGDLIRGTLVASGNDAAYATAWYASGGDVDSFIAQMNQKANEMGLSNTHFANPHGLDAENHHTTSKELAQIFLAAIENEILGEIMQMRTVEAHALNADEVHNLKNTNKLLSDVYPYMRGGKTGFTDNAGFCLVSLSASPEDDEIITVVLGSDLSGNQFQDSKALIEWTYNNYSWK